MTLGRTNIRRIVVDDAARGFGFTQEVIGRLPGIPVERGPGGVAPGLTMGKDTLHLVRYAGEFLKPCPGTRNYICCGYQILNLAANCPMDCSYCILQAYFNQPNLRVFVNLHEGLKRALEEIDSHPERMYRVGTGEFTDSLALDPVVSWTRTLLPEFSRRKNAILELKTKTDRIQGVLSVPWRDRIVLSWSLNSSQVVSREEHGSGRRCPVVWVPHGGASGKGMWSDSTLTP